MKFHGRFCAMKVVSLKKVMEIKQPVATQTFSHNYWPMSRILLEYWQLIHSALARLIEGELKATALTILGLTLP